MRLRSRRRLSPLTVSEKRKRDRYLAEEKQRNKQIAKQEGYAKAQKRKFYAEYCNLCRKYGCRINSLSGEYVSKVWRGETISTLKSHLDGLKKSLQWSDRSLFRN